MALSVSAPTAHELTEWAIRLDPSLAKSSPREAINSAVTLYMRAGEVGARWEQLKMEFARNQIREADGPAVVASEGDEDTMIDWLKRTRSRMKKACGSKHAESYFLLLTKCMKTESPFSARRGRTVRFISSSEASRRVRLPQRREGTCARSSFACGPRVFGVEADQTR